MNVYFLFLRSLFISDYWTWMNLAPQWQVDEVHFSKWQLKLQGLESVRAPEVDYGWRLSGRLLRGWQKGIKEGLMESKDRLRFPSWRGKQVGVTWQDQHPTGWAPVFGYVSRKFRLVWDLTDLAKIPGVWNVLDGYRSPNSSFPQIQIECSGHFQRTVLMPSDPLDYFCASCLCLGVHVAPKPRGLPDTHLLKTPTRDLL